MQACGATFFSVHMLVCVVRTHLCTYQVCIYVGIYVHVYVHMYLPSTSVSLYQMKLGETRRAYQKYCHQPLETGMASDAIGIATYKPATSTYPFTSLSAKATSLPGCYNWNLCLASTHRDSTRFTFQRMYQSSQSKKQLASFF